MDYHRFPDTATHGIERFFRTAYTHQLAQEWFPTVDGLLDRLDDGVRVADVGCGHSYELQRRLTAHGATTVAVAAHPGFADTDLIRNSPAVVRLLAPAIAPLITQDSAMGALPTLRAATDLGVLGGQYYGPGGPGQTRGNPRPVTSSTQSYDSTVQQRLWTVSEHLTGTTFPI